MTAKLDPPRIKYLGTSCGLPVFLVDGYRVRQDIDIDFTMGGNEAVYPRYVPRGEIWLDDAANWNDRNATALHEIVERHEMMAHMKNYEQAHDVASAVERPFRAELAKNPTRGFAAQRVTRAYNAYLRDGASAYKTRPRPNDRPRSARELDAEIASEISNGARSQRRQRT